MKKLNQKGFSHHLMLAGAAVLVVAAVGFAGWRIFVAGGVEANAASYKWTDLSTRKTGCASTGATVCVCKESLNATTWKIRAMAVNKLTGNKETMGWQAGSKNAKLLSGTVKAGATSSVHYKSVAKKSLSSIGGGVGWAGKGAAMPDMTMSTITDCVTTTNYKEKP